MVAGLAVKPQRAFVGAKRVATPARGTAQVARALETQLVISGATAGMLALGRLVFLPYQRRIVEKAGPPVQNGVSHYEAGDRLAEEASFILKSQDPEGFNIIDVMGYGALGHALGFAALASASLQQSLS